MENDENHLSRRELRRLKIEKESLVRGDFSSGKTISSYKKEKSERLENRKLVIRRRKLGLFFITILVFSILVIIFLSQFIASVKVSSKDISIKDYSKYTNIIKEYLDANPTERIISSLSKESLLSKLQSTNPEVLSINKISFAGLTTYDFQIEFRKPVASWGDDLKKIYVDSKGVAFSNNLFEAPSLTVIDESGISATSGQTVASSSFLSFIGKLIAAAKDNNLSITKIRIPPASLRQVEVNVEGVKYPAKMLTTESAAGQMANFKKSMDYFNKYKISPEYIDLRVEGRGYYK